MAFKFTYWKTFHLVHSLTFPTWKVLAGCRNHIYFPDFLPRFSSLLESPGNRVNPIPLNGFFDSAASLTLFCVALFLSPNVSRRDPARLRSSGLCAARRGLRRGFPQAAMPRGGDAAFAGLRNAYARVAAAAS